MTGVVLVTVAPASVCARIVLHFFARIPLAGFAPSSVVRTLAKNSAPVGLRVPAAKLVRIEMSHCSGCHHVTCVGVILCSSSFWDELARRLDDSIEGDPNGDDKPTQKVRVAFLRSEWRRTCKRGRLLRRNSSVLLQYAVACCCSALHGRDARMTRRPFRARHVLHGHGRPRIGASKRQGAKDVSVGNSL